MFATLEPPERREFSIEGQLRAAAGRRLMPIKFCRQCGQEYYHVQRADSDFLPHPVGFDLDEDKGPARLSDAGARAERLERRPYSRGVARRARAAPEDVAQPCSPGRVGGRMTATMIRSRETVR